MLRERGTVLESIIKSAISLGLILISSIVAASDQGTPERRTQVPASQQPMDGTFAVVGGEKISMEEYRANLSVGYRRRFFHGKIPDEELKSFRRDVADTLIDNVMLRQEAQRRGLKPDSAWVARQMKQYKDQVDSDKNTEGQRDEILADLRTKLEQDSLRSQLKRQVKDIPDPDEGQVRAYYRRHPDRFTTPQALRVSLILLTVDPSSPSSAWRSAYDKAKGFVKRIRGGDADFEQLAYRYSGDKSAQKGGDLGFIHKGMLSKDAQQVVDGLKEGQVSDPVQLLRGIAVFRLDERKPPTLNPFAQVEARARQLLKRERAKAAWQGLRDRLRKETPYTINDAAL